MNQTISNERSQIATLWHSVWLDLQPFEGRFAMTWRIAIVCSLTAMMFMTYGVPLVSIGCYLIMYLAKPTAQENILTAIAISILVSLIVPVLLWLAALSIDDPMWRLIIIVLASYIFVFIGAVTPLGEQGNIVGLVIAFAITLLPFTPLGEIITRGVLYAWLMVLIPMGVVFVFHLFAGRSSRKLLNVAVAEKLELIAAVLSDTTPEQTHHSAIRKQLLQGISQANNYLKLSQLFHLLPKAQSQAMRHAIDNLEDILILMSQSSNKPSRNSMSPMNHQELAQQCQQLAQQLRRNQLGHAILEHRQRQTSRSIHAQIEDIQTSIDLQQVARRIHFLFEDNTPASRTTSAKQPTLKKPKTSFLKEDAWRNPEYSRQAIKTTAAATLAYMIYTVIHWDGIHTAMITCYVVSLGSTGETVHKLTLRIVGCLIGAAMGIASITWLMPQMTSIGELMLLVFIGVLIAAWVSSGPERISYGGIQIGLAFLMTVLQGFGPAVDISIATDRIYGILLGNVLMFLAFTRLWPVSVTTTIKRQIKDITSKLEFLRQSDLIDSSQNTSTRRQQVNQILTILDQSYESLSYNHFEPKALQLSSTQSQEWKQTLQQLETLMFQYARNEILIQNAQQDAIRFKLHQAISETLETTQMLLDQITTGKLTQHQPLESS